MEGLIVTSYRTESQLINYLITFFFLKSEDGNELKFKVLGVRASFISAVVAGSLEVTRIPFPFQQEKQIHVYFEHHSREMRCLPYLSSSVFVF